jgi:hypothetical protein
MHIGQYRHADLALHFGKNAQAFVNTQTAHRFAGTAVGLVVGGLENVGIPSRPQTSFMWPATSRQKLLGFSRARTGDQKKRLVKSSLETTEFHLPLAC